MTKERYWCLKHERPVYIDMDRDHRRGEECECCGSRGLCNCQPVKDPRGGVY